MMLNQQRSSSVAEATPTSRFRDVFPEGEIYVVADDESLILAAWHDGFTALPLSDAMKLPSEANVVLFL